jgi:hypothetical protein
MIGKIITGKSFRGCLLYCLNDKRQAEGQDQVMKERTEIIMFNKCGGDPKELVQQFNEVRLVNPQLSKPVLHITLSLAPGQQLLKGQLMEIAEQCAGEMGFDNNQFVAVQHRDTNHQHLHIVANRIGFDKRTVSDGNNYRKIAGFCRKMETKYKLKQVLNPRPYLSHQERSIPRLDMRKEQLKEDIRLSLLKAKNYREFVGLMQEKKYTVLKGRGIAFIDEKKVKTKGSEVSYSWQTIERILENKNMLFYRNLPGKNQGINTDNYFPDNRHDRSKQQDPSTHGKCTKPAAEITGQLLKPEQIPGHIPHELLKKKRKRKRQSHHL